jgi:hypothetical protein
MCDMRMGVFFMSEPDAVFTSWQDLRQRIMDDLADGSFRRLSQYSINAAGTGGSRSVSYRTIADAKALLELCEQEILKETGFIRRTYARNAGRG